MVSLTEDARKELDAYFESKERCPVRIFLAPGGCGGPKLALTLDRPGETDRVFEEKGHSFCINEELFATVRSVKIGLNHAGFLVEGDAFAGGGCAGCSGCQTPDK